MPDPTGPFRRGDRLLRSSDFSRVGRDGRRAAEQAFVLLVSRQERDRAGAPQRLGVTVSRKVGRAVVRNRVKRSIREWFRRVRPKLREGIDVVVIGRTQAAGLSGPAMHEVLCRLAHRVGATLG